MSEKIYNMKFSKIYELYESKIAKKGQSAQEMDKAIILLTGYNSEELKKQIENGATLQEFFDNAPKMHPNTMMMKGAVCGKKIEEIADPLMRKIRCMDKLIDEVSKGKPYSRYLDN